MRLLVIEDDDTLRESLAEQLIEAGYAVEQAADGREGLYYALEYPVDLAIIDLGLPGETIVDGPLEALGLAQARWSASASEFPFALAPGHHTFDFQFRQPGGPGTTESLLISVKLEREQ